MFLPFVKFLFRMLTMCPHFTIINSLIHLIFQTTLGWRGVVTPTPVTGPWCSLPLALVGHFRAQGMLASEEECSHDGNRWKGQDRTHTHTQANRYLKSTKSWLSLVGDAKMKRMRTCLHGTYNSRWTVTNALWMTKFQKRGYRWHEPQERLPRGDGICASPEGWVGIGQAERPTHGHCR